MNRKFHTASNKHCWGLGMRPLWNGYQTHPPPSPSSPVPLSWISSGHLWLGWIHAPAQILPHFHVLSPPERSCGESKGGESTEMESPKCKVQSAPEMLNLHFLHKHCLGVWEDNSINSAHRAGKRERVLESDCNSTTERGDFSWPSWVEEIDSQVYILSLFTLATILSKGQSSNFKVTCDMHCTWLHSHAPPYHIREPGNKAVLLYCTFTVEIWKGVAMPWIGSIMASYFRSARKAVKLWDVPLVKAY